MMGVLIWTMAQLAAVPPPMPQTTADCSRPVYATDQLVCEDPGLRALDGQLSSLTTAITDERLQGRWIEDATAWFRRSRLCAFKADHRGCIAAAYLDRLLVMSALSSSLPKAVSRCDISGGVATAGRYEGGVLLIHSDRVVALAMPATPAWRPFIGYVRTGNRTTIRDLAGAVIARCRDVPDK